MKFSAFFLILVSVLILSCDNTTLPVADCQAIVVDNIKDITSDPFTFRSVSVEGNNLIAEVEYGGGCNEVRFDLFTDLNFMESNPAQCSLKIRFQDNDDCEAIVRKKLCFDLTKVSDAYKSLYETSSDTILLRISGYETIIRYTF